MINSVLLHHRVVNGGGVRAFSTSSVKSCETKNDCASSNTDDKTGAEREVAPTATPALIIQTTEDDSKGIKLLDQNEERAALNADDGGNTPQGMDVKIEPATVTNPIKSTVPKSGKESLLELLGAMKVEVTTKRKLRNVQTKQSFKSAHVKRAAAMESNTSVVQQAPVEASSQR